MNPAKHQRPSERPSERPSPVRPLSTRAAASHSSIRESNLALVASELFAAGGGLSRADLSVRTGLTRATISRLVRELLELKIIVEAEPSEAEGAGRPATPLFPASGTMVGIGLEVNADRISGCAIDLAGEVVAGFAEEMDLINSDSSRVLRLLATRTAKMTKELEDLGIQKILGVHLGVPGIVDSNTNRVVNAPNLGWRSVYPAEFLRSTLGNDIRLVVDNDANLQAISAAAQPTTVDQVEGPTSFVYLTGDIGIGGSTIVDGVPDKGPHGRAGEIGHMTIEPNGPDCYCGSTGCLERYVGKRAILTAAGLPEIADEKDFFEALDKGDTKALEAVHRAGWALGIAIANVVNLQDVDHVVLGTFLAALLPWLRPSLNAELDRRIMARSSADVTIIAASEDKHPTARGGALLALQSVLEPQLSLTSPERSQ